MVQNVQLEVIDASNNGDKFLRRPISKILLFIKMKLMVQFRCERWKYLLRRACAENSVAVMISQQNFDCSMRKFGKRFFINFNTPECNN